MAKFYNSNNDKYETPTVEGWFIGYKTESGDSGYVLVDREPTSEADAESTLLCLFGYGEYFDELYWDYNEIPLENLDLSKKIGLTSDEFEEMEFKLVQKHPDYNKEIWDRYMDEEEDTVEDEELCQRILGDVNLEIEIKYYLND